MTTPKATGLRDPRPTMSAKTARSKFSKAVAKGLSAAAEEAKRVARMHGTPIYVVEDGKVVAKTPWDGVAAWIVFIPEAGKYRGGFFGDRGREWEDPDIDRVRSQLRKHADEARALQHEPTERFVELVHFAR